MPLKPMLDLLAEDKIKTLPIFVIDLFPGSGEKELIPAKLTDVKNPFGKSCGDSGNDCDDAAIPEALNRAAPGESPWRAAPGFVALLRPPMRNRA